jgi:hypothetical protein
MRLQADQRRQELTSEAERDHQAEWVVQERPSWTERIMEAFGHWFISIGNRIEAHYIAEHWRRQSELKSSSAELRRRTL